MKGLKTDYRLAADFPVLGESRIVLFMGGSGIQRFDYRTDAWVEDREMASIYIGSPLVRPITEQQARGTIERCGGTWAAPSGAQDAELTRLDELMAQMQANADAVPIPPGTERIEEKGTVVPYWLVPRDDGKLNAVVWTGGNGVRIWRFDYDADEWVRDPEIPSTFIGTPGTAPLTEQESKGVIERWGGTWEDPRAATR
jgi:hypothetical protein